MSQGVYVLGGKCPGDKCPGGICPWGKCLGGKCPGGLCPRTVVGCFMVHPYIRCLMLGVSICEAEQVFNNGLLCPSWLHKW